MKKATLLLTLCLAFALSSLAQIKFINQSLDQALERAKKENKYIIVDVYAVWCGPCKKMAATTFQNSEVGDFVNKNMIALKLDGEKSGGTEFAVKHGVRAYPTLIVLNPKGKMVKQKAGAMDVFRFMNFVSEYKSSSKKNNSTSFNEESYFELRSAFKKELQETLAKEENGDLILKAMSYGQESKDFEFDELKYEVNKSNKTNLLSILEVFYKIGQANYDKAIEVFQENSLSMETLTKSQLHYLILEFLNNKKLDPNFLVLLNEHAIKTKDVTILETKILLQHSLQESKDAKETMAKTKKIISKNKKELPKSLELLEKAL